MEKISKYSFVYSDDNDYFFWTSIHEYAMPKKPVLCHVVQLCGWQGDVDADIVDLFK